MFNCLLVIQAGQELSYVSSTIRLFSFACWGNTKWVYRFPNSLNIWTLLLWTGDGIVKESILITDSLRTGREQIIILWLALLLGFWNHKTWNLPFTLCDLVIIIALFKHFSSAGNEENNNIYHTSLWWEWNEEIQCVCLHHRSKCSVKCKPMTILQLVQKSTCYIIYFWMHSRLGNNLAAT